MPRVGQQPVAVEKQRGENRWRSERNQKDAVYEAIKQLKPGAVDKDTPVVLSKQEKHLVEEKLFEGFRKKKIQYNKDLPSDDKG